MLSVVCMQSFNCMNFDILHIDIDTIEIFCVFWCRMWMWWNGTLSCNISLSFSLIDLFDDNLLPVFLYILTTQLPSVPVFGKGVRWRNVSSRKIVAQLPWSPPPCTTVKVVGFLRSKNYGSSFFLLACLFFAGRCRNIVVYVVWRW